MANWLFSQLTTHVVGLKFIFASPMEVLSFKFRENQLRGFRDPEDRKLPFPITLAGRLCNNLYYGTSRDYLLLGKV